MTKDQPVLKKEIRILGIAATDSKSERRLVGIIFRGNLWLDGILTCSFDTHTDYISDIARTILKSRQYSQIRVIISRENSLPKGLLDLRKLSLETHLPTISIKSKNHSQSTTKYQTKQYVCIQKGRKKVTAQTLELDKRAASEIYLIACRGNSLVPEALRTAELITVALGKSI